jgi:glycosyltransferase involved in cell wall biosynthesis
MTMTQLRKIAFIGNSLPRRCGIATFTSDLQQAVSKSPAKVETVIVAMNDHGHTYDYPPSVSLQIRDENLEDYISTSEALNAGRFDVVCLQHEFGIFGGEAGSHILELMSRLNTPIVTTLHTVLAEPNAAQRRVLTRIIETSAKVIVMAEKGRALLRQVYDAPADKIEVIPHGIPDIAFAEPDLAKAKLGFSDRPVILTFGLLSPNKGIEVMIDAMPLILESSRDAVYVVLGATHPNLIRNQGEAYRESLVARVQALGIENHVVFLDQFVDQAKLLDFISMCDVYATPYLNEAQMTSGTLAYSFGLGKAVVSTPYWHARELLAEGRGILVASGDVQAIGTEIAGLLTDDTRRDAMRARAYASSRSMTWQRTAERYVAVFETAKRHLRALATAPGERHAPTRSVSVLPETQLTYFLSMCDDTGLFQHAVHSVPDRAHGYCVDDNARALLLASALNTSGEKSLPETLTSRFASFVQHAWNPDKKHFRNFMGFDRRWLEDMGSEDSHGRTLWALGECARSDINASRRSWAAALFAEALPTVEMFRSPRAWAFTLLGLDGYCAIRGEDLFAKRMRRLLADRLMDILVRVETGDWTWFEEGLSYDNARLPQALIITGHASGTSPYVVAGVRTLRWLMTKQTAPGGHFRPIGTDGFGDIRKPPQEFDQQPLEATATISACLAAWHADQGAEWKNGANSAFAWFLGSNDLSQTLVDIDTGSCRDGLHRLRVNENRGGESVISYLLALVEFRRFARVSEQPAEPAPLRALCA